MEDEPRIFTVEEANALVPTLELELGELARLRSELENAIEAVGGPEQAVAILQRGEPPRHGKEDEGLRLEGIASEISVAMTRIQAFGCVLKDLDAGLVDFYAMRDDEPVFLCWQLGEPAVAHWHPLDEGFAGRRVIEGVEVELPKFMN